MPYKLKVDNQWMAKVTIRGQVHRHRCKTKREAVEWEEQKRKEPEACKTSTVSLHEWAQAYLDYAKDRFVQKTYDEKLLAFRELFKGMEAARLEVVAFRGSEALRFLSTQERARGGNATNKLRKNLRAAWQWGIKFLGMPKDNPFDAVPRFAEVRRERRVPSLSDFWAIYNLSSEGDGAMLLFALHTGARRDEIFRCKWTDIDFKTKRIRLKWRKNQAGEWREQWLPMTEDLEKSLKRQRLNTGMFKFVFMTRTTDGKFTCYQYRQHWLKNLCRRAKVNAFGFHGVRHLFASILASRNVPLVEIQKMLRHSSITTTAKYIHSLQEGSREAIEALPRLKEGMG